MPILFNLGYGLGCEKKDLVLDVAVLFKVWEDTCKTVMKAWINVLKLVWSCNIIFHSILN